MSYFIHRMVICTRMCMMQECNNSLLTILEETSLLLSCLHIDSLRCTTPEDLHATLQTTTAILLLIQSTIFLLNFLSLLILCLRSLKRLPFYFLLAHCPCTLCSWFAISKFQPKTLLMCVTSSSLHKNKSKCYCPWLKKKRMLWRCNWETDRHTHTHTHTHTQRDRSTTFLCSDLKQWCFACILPWHTIDLWTQSRL
jgi:hypothetical protein